MKRKEIRQLARQDLDDVAKPPLWTDAFLNAAIDEAEVEACRRARLLIDSSDNAVCRLAVNATESLYTLDPRVIFVRRVKSDRRSAPLCKVSYRELDSVFPGWEAHTGEVERYCLDFQTGKLLTYRQATALTACTLSLTVVRAPLKAILDDNCEPEIAPRYHSKLRHYAVFLAYMKPDEDTYRPDKAKVAMALFEQEFGGPSRAQDETWITEHHGEDLEEGLF